MNYFEHHIGDYDKNTAHLTACEDGIYSRMIRRYYDKEVPLPADLVELCRLVRARSREEKKAVASVAAEFFLQVGDALTHKICDAVIQSYKAGEPEREAKKGNENLRLQRHREERAKLFSLLNDAGIHLSWNTPMQQVREAVERLGRTEPTEKPATPATAPATPATATHPPVTNHQTPDTKGIEDSSDGTPAAPAPPAPPVPPPAPKAKPKAAPKPASDEPAPTAATWEAYSAAYELVYRAQPVRNAKVNSQLKQLIDRIGAEEAPHVATFFLSHQNTLYVRALHPVDLLLKDCEGLRTQWITGRKAPDRSFATGETAYQQSQRENVAAFTGGLISRKTTPQPETSHAPQTPVVRRIG